MICFKCNKEAEEKMFAVFKHRDGRAGRRNVCKECRNKYALDNFEKQKLYRQNYNSLNKTRKSERDLSRRMKVKNIVDKIKEENPCSDCGIYFPPVAMDFDHIGPKNKSIANMVSQAYKIDLILEEIKNCEIVCACCHRIRTSNRKQNLSKVKPC